MLLDRVLTRLVRPVFRRWREARYGYTRLVEVVVHREALLHNLLQYQRIHPVWRVAPVLKSNAYGHGLVEVARVFDRPETPFLVVDGYYEALILRNEGIRARILVIGYTATENIVACKLNGVAFTLLDLEQLRELSETLTVPRCFHLKLDTGMHRQGVLPAEQEAAFEVVQRNKNMVLDGLCSHLADADAPETTFTEQQIARWNQAVSGAKQAFPHLKYLHLANTAGSAFAGHIEANVMRVGIGLYGINPSPHIALDLRPALEVQSQVAAVKRIQQGDKVGYNVTYEAERDGTLAIIPTGYNSCVDRRLSNKGFFQINNVACPIVGRVSMNITIVDADGVRGVKKGDPVTVISAQKDDPNSVEHIAALCGTIPYVILVNLSSLLRRRVV